MGNVFCYKKDLEPYKNNDLLNNTIHCHYCNNTMLFNEYYKHLNTCKRENIDYHNIYFTS
jgi:hypothetical protein